MHSNGAVALLLAPSRCSNSVTYLYGSAQLYRGTDLYLQPHSFSPYPKLMTLDKGWKAEKRKSKAMDGICEPLMEKLYCACEVSEVSIKFHEETQKCLVVETLEVNV